MAETVNGRYQAGAIHRHGPWRSLEATEFIMLERAGWFNDRRLLEPINTSRRPRLKPTTTPRWTTRPGRVALKPTRLR